jgi:hypothetical protein
VPEVYISPKPGDAARVLSAVDRRLKKLASQYPGLARTKDQQGRIHIVVPQALRIPDVEYFSLLAERFAGYIRRPDTLPKWEKPNLLVKYWVTTQGVKAAREAH